MPVSQGVRWLSGVEVAMPPTPFNMSIDADPQQHEGASPLVSMVR